MSVHLQREIETLKRKIMTLGAVVEEQMRHAIRALQQRDADLAQKAIDMDSDIDAAEVEIEEECLKILALHQPVAIDLRFIIAAMKINNDLERIGDLSVNVAERALFISDHPPVSLTLDFTGLSSRVKAMVKESLDAMVNLNVDLAQKVCRDDDEVDQINREIFAQICQGVRDNPAESESLIQLMSASRHLERIGDHATNIAEDVIYTVEGDIVRHHPDRKTSKG